MTANNNSVTFNKTRI